MILLIKFKDHEKNTLKHLTVVGFANSKDLSNCEELNEAKSRFKLAKKDVKDAREKLNQALEEVINKTENKKKKKED